MIRARGRLPYGEALAAMRAFTANRAADTPDELWIVEHPPVYTVGQAGRAEHLPRGGASAGIPVEQVDRGGQITYHGPGQAVVYTLVDLARRGIKVRTLVTLLEQAVIDLLAAHGSLAARRTGAPGVYVGDAKIAALGLRVRNGRAYHGVALNVDVDLAPFGAIDPCGYPGLAVTRTVDLGIPGDCDTLGHALAARIARSISESS